MSAVAKTPIQSRAIGVFDSGLGGLSVLRHLLQVLPDEDFIYVADSGRAPYGARTALEVLQFSREIIAFLHEVHQCKLIVMACNTATAAAAQTLRSEFAPLPIIGMEPAVKPAAAATKSGKVGVMATAGTIASDKYAELLRAFGKGLELYEDACLDLVGLIEAGHLDDEILIRRLHAIIDPMRKAGIDTIVLGCTHFPLVEAHIREVAGPLVSIIDPAPAVARYTVRKLKELDLYNEPHRARKVRLYTSGDVSAFRQNLGRLLPGQEGMVVESLRVNGLVPGSGF